jgi:hypothetical protein
MPSVRKSKAEIPTIDCALVTITTKDGDEFGFDTSNKVGVETQTEEQDAIRLVVKGILRAQKKKKVTIVGTTITLTDNVFNPDLVLALQGGTCTYDTNTGKLTSYTPPVAGSREVVEPFTLNCYSAQYDTSGDIINYEKISYPNCTGEPIAFSSEDDVFRAPEYTIDSAPKLGEAPYEITYVDELPTLAGPGTFSVTQNLTDVTTNYDKDYVYENGELIVSLTAGEGMTSIDTVTVMMGTTNITSQVVTRPSTRGALINIPAVTDDVTITAVGEA